MSAKKDWSKINKNLIASGSLQIWIPENCAKIWFAKHPKKAPGRPNLYSDAAIQIIIVIQCFLNKPLRQTCGFANDLFSQSKFNLRIPDYTTLSRRYSAIEALSGTFARYLGTRKHNSNINILLDSTGLKFRGPGHWLARKKGSQRTKWIKLHIAVNAKTQNIESWMVTPSSTADSAAAITLLKNISGNVALVTADGAYDTSKLRKCLWERKIRTIIPPQFNARLQAELPKSQHDSVRVGPHISARDDAIRKIRENRSKKAWMEQSGYHKRSLVETAMSRLKGAFGDRLRSRKPSTINAELSAKIAIANFWMSQNQREQSL